MAACRFCTRTFRRFFTIIIIRVYPSGPARGRTRTACDYRARGCRRNIRKENEGSPAAHCRARLRNQRTSTPSVPAPLHHARNPPQGHSRTFFLPSLYFRFSSRIYIYIYPVLPSLRRTLRNYRTEGKCAFYTHTYTPTVTTHTHTHTEKQCIRPQDDRLYCVYVWMLWCRCTWYMYSEGRGWWWWLQYLYIPGVTNVFSAEMYCYEHSIFPLRIHFRKNIIFFIYQYPPSYRLHVWRWAAFDKTGQYTWIYSDMICFKIVRDRQPFGHHCYIYILLQLVRVMYIYILLELLWCRNKNSDTATGLQTV